MASLQITYAGYAFHEEGVPHYGQSLQPGEGSSPARLTETFKVRMRFFGESFADNEAAWKKLKTAVRNAPRGLLRISDENGTVLAERTVKCTGTDGDAEWGQFRREVTVGFEAAGGTGVIAELTAHYAPNGKLPVELPNVDKWSGQRKNSRPTTHSSHRNEGMDTVTASGRWAPDAALSDPERRDALLLRQKAIESIADCPDGLLTYGSYSTTMQVESVNADIADTLNELTWSLSCFRRVFPDGTYAEADYTVENAEDNEEGKRSIVLSGKIIANTEAQARAEAERIRKLYEAGRTYLGGTTTKRVVSGPDSEDPCVELNFSFRFRETLDVVSWKLKITTSTDTRTGDITTTYSGNVVAKTAEAALKKARELGGQRDTTELLLMSKSEDVGTQQAGEGSDVLFIGVDFTYTYLGKSDVLFAEIQTEQSEEFYGSHSLTVSGSVTAGTQELALAFARTFKPEGMLILSRRESDGQQVKDHTGAEANALSRHFTRVDFSYVLGRTATRVTIAYTRQVQHDYQEGQTNVSYSGTAYGPDVNACDTLINSVAGIFLGSRARKMRDERTDDWKMDGLDKLTLFLQRPFSISYVTPLSAADAADIDILECSFNVSRRWGIWKTVIDEIPYGEPFVQPNVALTCGSMSVTGSITAIKEATARNWGRSKQKLCTGFMDEPDENTGFIFLPRNGADVKRHTFAFTYASKDPALAWKP